MRVPGHLCPGQLRYASSSLISLNARQLSVWGGGMQLLQEDLNAILSPKMRIVVLGGTERSARAAAEDLQNSGVPCEYRDDAKTLSLGRVTVLPGSLSAGFEYQRPILR